MVRKKSFYQKPAEVRHKWLIFDATGKILGRFSTRIARILQGKHKPTYTPSTDCGDYIIVINAEKLTMTGKKMEDKEFIYHTGWPKGLRRVPVPKLMIEYPDRVISNAVRRMMPKSKLGKQMMRKLKIYRGSEHPHVAQNPEPISL